MEPKADLAALADRVESRRLELGLSIDRAAEAGGLSATTWSRVEQAKTVRKLTYAGVERVLGWAQGACQQIMNGREPNLLTPVHASASEPRAQPRYPDDPVLQYLWDTPDPSLTDDDREALVQVYRALKYPRARPATAYASRRRATAT